MARHGRLDAVVHTAGVAGGGPVHLVPAEEWDRVVDINLKGTFLVGKHTVAAMLTQEPVDGERGAIVNSRASRAWPARRAAARTTRRRVAS